MEGREVGNDCDLLGGDPEPAGPVGSGLRILPFPKGVRCDGFDTGDCDAEPALSVEVKEALLEPSAVPWPWRLGEGPRGRGEVAWTRARAADEAVTDSDLLADEGMRVSQRRWSSVSLSLRYRITTILLLLREDTEGKSVSPNFRFLTILALFKLRSGRECSLDLGDEVAEVGADGKLMVGGRPCAAMLPSR